MLFRQFHLSSLGHASYLIGDDSTGQALLFDPRRDVEEYFAVARAEGLRITHAMDSHGHNDYLSGLSEVVARADVQVLGSAAADLGYDHQPVRDREVIEFGDLSIEVLHTPGHTPEHVSLLLRDRSAGDEPAILLSGGALLVGDLARPDLLGGPEAAQQAARDFCHTLQEKVLALPDYVEVYPTHVAGSLCGGNIGSRLSTTIGYERHTNAVLAQMDNTEGFVRECIRLDNLPAVPPYWRRMRQQNLDGVTQLGVLPEPATLSPAEVEQRRDAGAVVVDCRQPEAYGSGHVPGALNVGYGSSFPTWAGTVIPDGVDVVLVVDRPDDVAGLTSELLRIGYPPPVGWLAGGMFAWRTSGRPFDQVEQISVGELSKRLDADEVDVLDVRQPSEWSAGHIPGATFITGAELPERLDEVQPERPLAVICGSGYRSSASLSLLSHHGRGPLLNVLGGMSAWQACDLPVEQ